MIFLTGCAAANTQYDAAEHEAEMGATDRALRNYMAAAEKGHAPAMTRIGEYYLNGIGVAEDAAEAFRWFEKAAEQNEPKALYYLGLAYIDGKGVERNLETGFDYVHRSAMAGLPEGQVMLATCYMDGIGTAEDPELGFAWYRRAAEQGNADGAFFTASCYMIGAGVGPDMEKACEWFDVAAEGGIHDAIELQKFLCGEKDPLQKAEEDCQALMASTLVLSAEETYRLARCYQAGLGVGKDEQIACELFKEAAANGSAEAQAEAAQCSK